MLVLKCWRRPAPLSLSSFLCVLVDVFSFFFVTVQPVGNDGTVAFRNRERISFDYILSRKFAGDMISMRLLRNKQRITVEVPHVPSAAS